MNGVEDTVLILISIAFIIFMAIVIPLVLEIRRSLTSVREFLKNTEETLNPTLQELKETLESIRHITNDVGGVTDNVKEVSDALAQVSKNVKKVSGYVDGMGVATTAKIIGLKAGIMAGAKTFMRSIITKEQK